MARILVVDDEPNVLKVLEALLIQDGNEVVAVASAEDALEALADQPCDLMISDLRLGRGMDGLELLHEGRIRAPHMPTVMITAYGTIEVAVQAMKEGAFDFIRKPFRMEELLETVRNALRHRRIASDQTVLDAGEITLHFGSLVGESEPMKRIYGMIERIAKTDTTVLIQGESGTGKELIAKAIHTQSRRADGPWVALNCAAIPAPLLESEMFGHAAGAFTGATQSRNGLFLAANRGTLFLDEISAMDLAIQGKFLRALQERCVRRVGENTQLPVDVRVVAATNESLAAKKDSGEFREDLFYRISVIPIDLPPLRHRTEDVPLLVRYFCRQQSEAQQRALAVEPEVVALLTEYAWPGNVRELENAIACAAALTEDGVIRRENLPPNIAGSGVAGGPATDHGKTLFTAADRASGRGKSLREFLREKEREYMRAVLLRTGGNRIKAAQLLGISRATLYRKLEE